MNSRMLKTAVLNPGNHPAPKWIAAELGRNENLASYACGLSIPSGSLGSGFWNVLPALQTELKRRTLPEGISANLLLRRGMIRDAFAALALRRGAPNVSRALLKSRNETLARAAVRSTKSSKSNASMLLFPTGTRSAAARLCASAKIPYSLYTPLPELAFSDRIMADEALANPEWAKMLAWKAQPHEIVQESVDEANGASLILANSEFTAESYRSVLSHPVDIRSVPLSLDRDRVWGAAGIEKPSVVKRMPQEPLRLVYLGQVVQRKGLSYLFEALDSLHDSIDCEVTLIGSDHLGMGKLLQRRYPAVKSTFLGSVPQSTAWQTLARSHAFVFPTLLDGFGNAMLEALAVGLPVVTTARTGAPDIGVFGSSGLEVTPGSSSSISAAIELLHGNEDLRQEMSNNAWEATAFGGWNRYAKDVVKILDETTSSHFPSSS